MAMDWVGFFSNLVARVPVERFLLPPPDHTKEVEKFYHSLVSTESPKQAASEEKMSIIPPTEKSLDKPIVAKAGTGCRGCTSKHFGKCAGALSEAIDFARSDGLESAEVERRLAFCDRELDGWEGLDATPESFVTLSDKRKVWVRKWLPKGRQFRHQLNSIKTMEDLERVAARAGDLHLEAFKELRELGELEDTDSGFLDEVQRQAKRVKSGELSKEDAVKELEQWQKSVKA